MPLVFRYHVSFSFYNLIKQQGIFGPITLLEKRCKCLLRMV